MFVSNRENERIWISSPLDAVIPQSGSVVLFTDEIASRGIKTSAARLGHSSYDLEPGDPLRCSFDLDMNMA